MIVRCALNCHAPIRRLSSIGLPQPQMQTNALRRTLTAIPFFIIKSLFLCGEWSIRKLHELHEGNTRRMVNQNQPHDQGSSSSGRSQLSTLNIETIETIEWPRSD